jgi:hypothetical protein
MSNFIKILKLHKNFSLFESVKEPNDTKSASESKTNSEESKTNSEESKTKVYLLSQENNVSPFSISVFSLYSEFIENFIKTNEYCNLLDKQSAINVLPEDYVNNFSKYSHQLDENKILDLSDDSGDDDDESGHDESGNDVEFLNSLISSVDFDQEYSDATNNVTTNNVTTNNVTTNNVTTNDVTTNNVTNDVTNDVTTNNATNYKPTITEQEDEQTQGPERNEDDIQREIQEGQTDQNSCIMF